MKFNSITAGKFRQFPDGRWGFNLIVDGKDQPAISPACKTEWEACIAQCNMLANKRAENVIPYKDYWIVQLKGDPFEKPNLLLGDEEDEEDEHNCFELSLVRNSFKHGQRSWGWFSFDEKIKIADHDDITFEDEDWPLIIARAVKFCNVLNTLEHDFDLPMQKHD